MGITDDPNHPGLKRGPADTTPVGQNEVYLVLSEAERAKGFTRPVRTSYKHVGIAGPRFQLRDLTVEEIAGFGSCPYAKYEEYPKGSSTAVGKFWTQEQLDSVGKGCGTVTSMGRELAETYARSHAYYGATYCCGCRMHRPVGKNGEFVWDGTDIRVGT